MKIIKWMYYFFFLDDCGLNWDGCLYDGICKDGVDFYMCECVLGFSGRYC